MPWVLLYSPGSLEWSDQDADVRLAFHLWSLGSTSPLTKAGPWGCRSVFEALVGSFLPSLLYLLQRCLFPGAV